MRVGGGGSTKGKTNALATELGGAPVGGPQLTPASKTQAGPSFKIRGRVRVNVLMAETKYWAGHPPHRMRFLVSPGSL